MEMEWIPEEHVKEKIIYNPLDDPVMKKKREMHRKKLSRDLLQIKIAVVAVTITGVILTYIYYSLRVSETEIVLMIVMAMIAVIAGLFAGVLQSKGIYKIKMAEILLLENGILYHKYYCHDDIPNPLYIRYENIQDISIETRPNSHNKRLIRLTLRHGTPYKKEIEAHDAAAILEETLPDIEFFYDFLKEQVEKARKKVKAWTIRRKNTS